MPADKIALFDDSIGDIFQKWFNLLQYVAKGKAEIFKENSIQLVIVDSKNAFQFSKELFIIIQSL